MARSCQPLARRVAGLACLLLLDEGARASPDHDDFQAETELQTSWQRYTGGRRLSDVGQETCEQIAYRPMEQIRIGYEFVDTAGVPAETVAHVENKLLKPAISYWMRTLKVRRATAPLRAERKGFGCQRYGLGVPGHVLAMAPLSCTSAKLPTCGQHTTIPEKFVKPTRVCTRKCPQMLETVEQLVTQKGGLPCDDCTELPGGYGAVGVDFMALVTIKESAFCKGSTLAHAATCVKDQCDRPIFGVVNYCADSLSLNPKDIDRQISMSIHELAHALAFTSNLFGYFRNPDGTPKLPRDPIDSSLLRDRVHWSCTGTSYSWRNPSGNRLYVDLAPAGIIQKFDERGIEGCPCPINSTELYPGCIQSPFAFREPNCIVKLITPRVQQEARAFFGCDTLPGAELENQATSACVIVNSHWEERIFMGELMTSGQFGDYIFLSRLTLAVFEDSGWYIPDYNMADPLVKGVHWGYQLGCDFALSKCVSDGYTRYPHYWCMQQGAKKCSLNRLSEVMCSLQNSPVPMKPAYTFFDNNQIGDTAEADYCPYYHTPIANHICTDPNSATFPASNVNFMREVFGEDSRCLESTLRANVQEGRGYYKPNPADFTAPRAGCFKVTCMFEPLRYAVLVSDLQGSVVTLGTCTFEGQALTSPYLQGQVTCAAPEQLCSEGLGRPRHVAMLFDAEASEEAARTLLSRAAGNVQVLLALASMACLASFVATLRCSRQPRSIRGWVSVRSTEQVAGAAELCSEDVVE